jgi:enolase
MMNVMNGGAHADWSTDFQEYMIMPLSADRIDTAVRMGAEVFHSLKKILKDKGYVTTVGDEGGYAPRVKDGNNEPLELIKQAVEAAGYKLGEDISIAMDIASSEFAKGDHYELKTNGDWKTSEDLANWYQWIIDNYPVVSIEDGLGENDWEVREMSCTGLEYLGVKFDVQHNATCKRGETTILSTPDSAVKVIMIPTDEEYMIAGDTYRLVK